jgi:hypothetical protein
MSKTVDLDVVNDEISQWSDTSRERMNNHWNQTGKFRGRKKKVKPVYSNDGDD